MGGDFAMTEVNELKYIYVTVLGKGIYVLDFWNPNLKFFTFINQEAEPDYFFLKNVKTKTWERLVKFWFQKQKPTENVSSKYTFFL